MFSIYDWYIMGGCVALLVVYILLICLDKGDSE